MMTKVILVLSLVIETPSEQPIRNSRNDKISEEGEPPKNRDSLRPPENNLDDSLDWDF